MTRTRTPVRLAVLGTGGWARRYHFPALAALHAELGVEVAGVWNRTPASAAEAAAQFRVGRVYATLDEAVRDESIDGYVVLVHSSAVLDVVTGLLVRGLPILTEKPPGSSYREALLLAQRTDVPNVVGFNRRYMPLARRFKALCDGIARPYFAECHFYRSERRYPGFVLETGVHGINFLEFLCGPIRSVESVHRHVDASAGMWVTSVVFESGMPGLVKFFPCSGSSVERYEVHGVDRSVYLDCPTAYSGDQHGGIVVHEQGVPAASIAGEAPDDAGLLSFGLLDEYREFVATIRNPEHPTTSNFRNACNTMRVAEVIEAAAGHAPRRAAATSPT